MNGRGRLGSAGAFRTGAVNQDRTGLMKSSDETMMPQALKAAGYATASVGKWSQPPLGPADFGFDDYLKFAREDHHNRDKKRKGN